MVWLGLLLIGALALLPMSDSLPRLPGTDPTSVALLKSVAPRCPRSIHHATFSTRRYLPHLASPTSSS